MSFSADDLSGYFESYGWQFERRDNGVFRTGFVGDTGHYDIWLRVGDAWVYFIINPYVPKPGGPKKDGVPHGVATLLAILRANHELNLAKFALDDDGDLTLCIELPLDGFCYAHFSDALTALSHYADDYRVRVDEALGKDAAEVV